MSNAPLLRVENLAVVADSARGKRTVVDRVSFEIGERTTLAMVGESGSGKSTVALALTGLLPPQLSITSGSILFRGDDLIGMEEDRLARLLGVKIAMVPQETTAALDPVCTVLDHLIGAQRRHRTMSRREARERAIELLRLLGFSPDPHRLRAYPHQLSAGMCTRVMMAAALSSEPELIVLDEPTSGIDSHLMAQILDVFGHLRDERGLGLLLVTRDLAVVAEFADQLVVLAAGRVAETGNTAAVFRQPAHAATRRLLANARSLFPREASA
jgi:ABC-type glutathione transport system ATPase component